MYQAEKHLLHQSVGEFSVESRFSDTGATREYMLGCDLDFPARLNAGAAMDAVLVRF